ncbi:MAG TPA: hypothetical protein VM925_25160 [Labilithrix sp.]|nr:hypothetical protein [Labilithrix sp.]
MGLLVLSGMMVVGCSEADGADGAATSASALTHVVPEAPGSNCRAGGQAFQFGIDSNGNDQLDPNEVKGTSFVCNGTSSELTPALEQIPSGDPRCAHGGTALRIQRAGVDGLTTDKEVVACNGAPGAQGAPGVQGDAGEQGPQGDAGVQGPAAPEPVLGQFLATQIVKGASLTCAGVNTTATVATCTGMKLNGLDVRLAGVEANMICQAITGKGFSTANGQGTAANPYLVWNGTTWALATTGASPMQNLHCNR